MLRRSPEKLRPVFGVVFEVGVLDEDEIAGHVAEAGLDRRPLAPVHAVKDDPDRRVLELREDLGRAVLAAVVDHDDLTVEWNFY
jgi:hypothetical protein